MDVKVKRNERDREEERDQEKEEGRKKEKPLGCTGGRIKELRLKETVKFNNVNKFMQGKEKKCYQDSFITPKQPGFHTTTP